MPIIFNRNIWEFDVDQQKYVGETMSDFMQQFEYFSTGEAVLPPDDDWMQEQQTKLNFYKYSEVNPNVINFRKRNAKVIGEICEPSFEKKVFVLNQDRSGMWLPTYPDFMKCSMKEAPQIKD